MRKRCLVLLSLVGSLAAGCQQSPYMHAHLELLNSEKRALEDELYDLGFEYERAQREIEKLKQQNARLRGVPESRGDTKPPDTKLAPPAVDEGTRLDPKIDFPSRPGSREPQQNEVPGATPPNPPLIPARPPETPGTRQAPGGSQVPTSNSLSLEPADPRVTHIFLNPLHTRGTNFDRQPGDDGIVVVIEPRNRDDAYVALAGPISVLVLDPAKTREEGRVLARWEIDANEAQQALRSSATHRGIELRLPWPGPPPQTNRLHLYVRYLTVDNRDLRADRALILELPGQFSEHWTPRAASRYSLASQGPQPAEEPAPLSAPAEPATETSPAPPERPTWRPDRS